MRKFVPVVFCDQCDNVAKGLAYELRTAIQFMFFVKDKGWTIEYIDNYRYDFCPECSKERR